MSDTGTRDLATTTVTRQLIALAEKGGLRPEFEPAGYGRNIVVLNGRGPDAMFGCLYLSARSGRVLRAFLTHGNSGTEQRYETVAEIRSALKSYVALQRG